MFCGGEDSHASIAGSGRDGGRCVQAGDVARHREGVSASYERGSAESGSTSSASIATGQRALRRSPYSRMPSRCRNIKSCSVVKGFSLPELRKDPIVGRWVIISTDRAKRPDRFCARSSAESRAVSALSVMETKARRRPKIRPIGRARTAVRRRSAIRRAGACAWCRTNSRRWASKAT